MSDAACRVYEHDSVQAITGDTIRPGGIALTEHALSYCPLRPGARVLDVGCGHAATIEYVTATRQVQAVGLDLSRRQLLAARQHRRDLSVAQAAGDGLPFPAGRFDLLLAECCLSLVEDRERALTEFARVLRSGGTLILSDIYARHADQIPGAQDVPVACCLFKALSREWLQAQLPQHNLSITLWEDHTPALRSLIGQIIFAHGSVAKFWQTLVGDSAQAQLLTSTAARLKPGYFLLLAQKQAG